MYSRFFRPFRTIIELSSSKNTISSIVVGAEDSCQCCDVGSGVVGGLFFPLVLFGASMGSSFALVVHGNPGLWGSVGISAAIGAGYKTPLAAVTFMGDTTGSVSYLVLGMIASGISYLISGGRSVSSKQITREELLPSELSKVKAAGVMKDRILSSLTSNSTVSEVIDECLRTRMNQTIFIDDPSARVVTLQDALKTILSKERACTLMDCQLRMH